MDGSGGGHGEIVRVESLLCEWAKRKRVFCSANELRQATTVCVCGMEWKKREGAKERG